MSTDSLTQTNGELDEARIGSSLERLQRLHVQLLNLRRAIPSVIEPLTLHHASPEDLYSAFSQRATSTGKELKAFTNTYHDPAIRGYFEIAQNSRTSDADGIRPWLIQEHPDWMEIKKEDIEEEMGLKVGRDVKSESSTHDQNVEEVLMRFREQKEGLSVTSVKDRDLQRIKLEITKPSICKQFDIEVKPGTIQVSCPGNSPFLRAVERCVASRPKADDLQSSLEMLASYAGSLAARCLKCDRLLNRNGLRPAARRQQPSKAANATSGPFWRALHEECL